MHEQHPLAQPPLDLGEDLGERRRLAHLAPDELVGADRVRVDLAAVLGAHERARRTRRAGSSPRARAPSPRRGRRRSSGRARRSRGRAPSRRPGPTGARRRAISEVRPVVEGGAVLQAADGAEGVLHAGALDGAERGERDAVRRLAALRDGAQLQAQPERRRGSGAPRRRCPPSRGRGGRRARRPRAARGCCAPRCRPRARSSARGTRWARCRGASGPPRRTRRAAAAGARRAA